MPNIGVSMNSVTFRCDANANCGFGHFSRCFNLALGIKAAAPDLPVCFWGDLNDFAAMRAVEQGFSLSESQPDHVRTGTIIHDQYSILQSDVDQLIDACLHYIKIDDFHEHDLSRAAAVINFRIGAEKTFHYPVQAFLGTRFYPSHPSLRRVRTSNLEKFKSKMTLERILVFVGGRDIYRFAPKLLETLGRVVSGKTITFISVNSVDSSQIQCENNDLVCKGIVTDMAAEYAKVDAIICGGGLTKYEAAFCTIPSACISQTVGQDEDTRVASELDLTYNLGSISEHRNSTVNLAERLGRFFEDGQQKRLRRAGALHFEDGSLSNLASSVMEVCS